MRATKWIGPSTRTRMGLLILSLSLVLTACGGSAVAPEEAARANSGLLGNLAGNGPQPVSAPVDQAGQPIVNVPADPSAPGGPGDPGDLGDPGDPPSVPGAPNVPVGAKPPTGGGKAASCDGFKNTTGITDTEITIGNVSDLSGPVPGIFTPALQAVKAYAAYFNATSSICGRKLAVKSYDSQTSAGAEQVGTQKSCDETFAAVGSLAGFDLGGAPTAVRCGIPEIHSIITNPAREACDNCFAAQAPQGGFFPAAIPDFFTRINKPATQKAAMLYVNAAAGVNAALGQVKSEENRGWKFSYVAGFDIAEFNYGPYVQQLKSRGVRIVQLFGSVDMGVRMAKAFKAAGYKPDYYVLNPTYYDTQFASDPATEGAIVGVGFVPLEEQSRSPELRLYLQWLNQVAPGAKATYFGLYAWSAARLFAEQAAALGGKLTRKSLVQRFKSIQDWTANGLHVPQDVGGKVSSKCTRFLQVKGGKFVPFGTTKYSCGPLSPTR